MADIKVLETYRAQCVKDVIEILETALEQAREGKVVAVAVAMVRPDGAGNGSFSETDNAMGLLGSVAMLHHRLLVNIETTESK